MNILNLRKNAGILLKIFILSLVLLLFSMSCNMNFHDFESLGEGQFWAQNLVTRAFYIVEAELLADNDLCEVWVEIGSGVSESQAKDVADQYKIIYEKIMDTFGWKANFGRLGLLNTMQAADLVLGNGDGKLTILLLDIKDTYTGMENQGYVAGYFWAGNFLNINRSNKRDMIYIDVNPGFNFIDAAYRTLAHEMQHLMNYVTGVLRRGSQMDLWIDEGLSSAAEWVYAGSIDSRIKWYNEDSQGTIKRGNNFFVWGDQHGANTVLDDYATVYLFFQWLRLHSEGKNIYYEIMISTFNDYRAVVNAFDPSWSWENLIGTWLAANYIQSSSGVYGYKGEIGLTKHYVNVSGGSINLFPGEGVFSSVNSGTFSIPADSGNIRYWGITASGTTTTSISAGDALLTYNSSSNNRGGMGPGIITNQAPLRNIQAAAHSNISMSASAFSEPNLIGARDVLRRSGYDGFDVNTASNSRAISETIAGEIRRYRGSSNE